MLFGDRPSHGSKEFKTYLCGGTAWLFCSKFGKSSKVSLHCAILRSRLSLQLLIYLFLFCEDSKPAKATTPYVLLHTYLCSKLHRDEASTYTYPGLTTWCRRQRRQIQLRGSPVTTTTTYLPRPQRCEIITTFQFHHENHADSSIDSLCQIHLQLLSLQSRRLPCWGRPTERPKDQKTGFNSFYPLLVGKPRRAINRCGPCWIYSTQINYVESLDRQAAGK